MPDQCSEGCMREVEVCRGGGRCEEERRWCQSEQRRNKSCPNFAFGYLSFSCCKGAIPGQCIQEGNLSDRSTTRCSDRSDAEPYYDAASPINTSLLHACYLGDGAELPGLMHHDVWEECIPVPLWCAGPPHSCPALGPRRTMYI